MPLLTPCAIAATESVTSKLWTDLFLEALTHRNDA
jgi:hypothetical protein